MPQNDPQQKREQDTEQTALQFARQVEKSLYHEKRAISRRILLMNLLFPVRSILAVFTGKDPLALLAFMGTNEASDHLEFMNQVNAEADMVRMENKLFSIFSREAIRDMPEIEREVKKAPVLREGIAALARKSSQFIWSRSVFVGSILGASVSALTAAAPALMGGIGGSSALSSVALMGGVMATAATVNTLASLPLLRRQRADLKQHQPLIVQADQQVGNDRNNVFANPALQNNTNSSQNTLQKLTQSVDQQEGLMARMKRCIRLFRRITTAKNIAINLTVFAACFYGLDMSYTALATVMMGVNSLNASVVGALLARYRIKENSDAMWKQYEYIRHNPIYTLQYGQSCLKQRPDTICLQNVQYAHRYNGTEIQNIGRRDERPVIQSRHTVYFRPGINVLGGPSGAGKSTLYKLLRHGDDLTGGSISYGTMVGDTFVGLKNTDMPKDEIGNHIAFCFQDIENDGRTALEMMQAANPYGTPEVFEKAFNTLDLSLYHITPDQKREPRLFSEYSKGERHKIMFLQAYLSPRPILVFDEPTSNVDDRIGRIMIDMLNKDGQVEPDGKTHKRTIIYTTHKTDELDILNVNQVVDLAPTQDEKIMNAFYKQHGVGSARLPTDITVIPFSTPAERESYKNLMRYRASDPKILQDKKAKQQSVIHDLQKFLSLSAVQYAEDLQKSRVKKETMGSSQPIGAVAARHGGGR